MDTTRINHNNSGHKYRIAVDIAKEGSHIWDLTPYFKGRVGDNNFGLQVTWYYQGQLMNIVGMKPYIEGLVGQYSFGKNGEIDMDTDAVPVRYDGSPDDCEEAGKATFYFPSQMFPKEGIFKGFIGVKDDRDGSRNPQISGVTIWFKVLPGIAQMGHACDVYISDLDKALQNFKVKLDQHDKDYQTQLQQVIDDARNAYESETKNAHDSLDALKAQIQANRDEQENLSQHLAGTEQQIQIHDVVTRPEFLDLSNQLSQQVAQMKEAGLEFFSNADDLKAKYPNGANKLCVTLNDSHEWIYDYANKQWADAGAFNYGTIDPKLTNAIYQSSPDNLILNSDFITMDLWNAARDHDVEPNCFIDTDNRNNNSNVLVMNGFVKDGTSNESWIKTNDIPLSNSTAISVGADLQITGINTRVGDSAGMDITWLDKDKKILGYYHYQVVPANDGSFRKYFWENIKAYPQAAYFEIAFNIYGEGCVRIRRPQANYGASLLPYAKENLKFDVKNWQLTTDGSTNAQFTNDSIIMTGDSNMANYEYLSSPVFWLNRKAINIEIFGKADWQWGSGEAYLEVREFTADEATKIADGYNPASVRDFQLPKGNKTCHYQFDHIELGSNTVAVIFRLVVHGTATLLINSFSVTDDLRMSNLLTYDNTSVAKALTLQNDMYNINTLANNANQYYYTKTKMIPVTEKEFKLSILAKGILKNVPKLALSRVYLEIDQYSDSQPNSVNAKLQINKEILPSVDLSKHEYEIKLDDSTKYYTVGITVLNNANISFKDWQIDFGRPQAKDSNTPDLIVPAYNFSNPSEVDFSKNSIKLSTTDADENNWSMTDSPYYRVIPGSVISLITLADSVANNARLEINQHSDLVTPVDPKLNIDIPINNGKYQQVKAENLKLAPSTNFISLRLAFSGTGSIEIGTTKFWYSNHVPISHKVYSKQLPQMNILSDAQITDKWTKAAFSFDDKDRNINGYLQFAMQGDSSRNYPKKNLKIKTFKDEECTDKLKWRPKADWDENNKFNIKANYIDATQARNLVNASIFSKATAITPFAFKDHENLAKSQNLGQMEGFPIELYFNYQYYGLMTLNTKKDDKPFGLDSSDTKEEAIVNDTVYNNVFGDSTKTIDGTAFETILQDKASDTLKTNFTNFEKFVGTSTDDDFKQHLADYIDINSVINAYLFGNLSRMFDFANKSIILLTWDEGKTYYLTLYDLDSTWGLYWDGSQLNSHPEAWSLDYKNPGNSITMIEGSEAQSNQLYRRLYKLFKPEIQAQYRKLRSTVWDNVQIINAFKRYIRSIPEDAYERDQAKWPDIPSKSITSFAQIQQAIIERGNAMDNFMEHLTDPQPTSPAPQPTTPQTQPASGTTPTTPQAQPNQGNS